MIDQKLKTFFCLIFFLSLNIFSQTKEIDSLKAILKTEVHDTTKMNALYKWANLLAKKSPNEALILFDKLEKLAQKDLSRVAVAVSDNGSSSQTINIKDGLSENMSKLKLTYLRILGKSFRGKGYVLSSLNSYDKALDQYFKSIEIFKSINDKANLATSLYNCAYIKHNLDKTKEALDYYKQSLKLYQEVKNKGGITSCISSIALLYSNLGQIDEAMTFYNISLKNYEETNDSDGITICLTNIANVFTDQGNVEKALVYYHRSLKISENMGDKKSVGLTLNNIGNVYYNQGQYNEAVNYYHQCLKISKEIDDKDGLARSYNNIASIYQLQKKLDEALDYFKKGLKLYEELSDKEGTSIALNNISEVYTLQGKLDLSLDYAKQSLMFIKDVNNKEIITSIYNNICNIYLLQGNINKSLEFGVKAFQLAKELGYPYLLKNISSKLKTIYEKQNDPKKALEMYELYITMRDSVSNEENRKASYKSHLQYEYAKKALADSIKSADDKKVSSAKLAESRAKLKQEKTQKIALYAIAGFLMFLAGTLFYNYRRKNKSNKLLSNQKRQIEQKNILLEDQRNNIATQNFLLETKNGFITDSIEYAKKIQDSMLPDAGILIKHFSDAFIYYQPKDIVSGDFYWINETPSEVVLAVGDCTGHGVPGALMSVLGHNCLDAAYGRLSDLTPINVIAYADKYMKQKTRNQNSSTGNVDGMALSLIHYNKTTKMMSYSSANQYIYIVREKELIEIKGNGFAIGSLQSQIIIGGEMQLVKDDMVYMFSDGYADQKGGPQKRKFMYPQLKNLFTEIAGLKAEQQHKTIKKAIEAWRGDLSQIDDILVVGIRA